MIANIDDRAAASWWKALTKKGQGDADHPQTIVLVIKPAPKPGRFLAYAGDDLIVTSRQPFLDCARALLAHGYDPAMPYNMRHANSATLSFITTTIGHAAGLSVNADRTRLQKFVPFEGPIKEAAE